MIRFGELVSQPMWVEGTASRFPVPSTHLSSATATYPGEISIAQHTRSRSHARPVVPDSEDGS